MKSLNQGYDNVQIENSRTGVAEPPEIPRLLEQMERSLHSIDAVVKDFGQSIAVVMSPEPDESRGDEKITPSAKTPLGEKIQKLIFFADSVYAEAKKLNQRIEL